MRIMYPIRNVTQQYHHKLSSMKVVPPENNDLKAATLVNIKNEELKVDNNEITEKEDDSEVKK